MRLSRNAVGVLKWMSRHDEWLYLEELEKNCKKYDYRSFNAIKAAGYIDQCAFEDEVPEYDEYGEIYIPVHYRISDTGKAFLEGRIFTWLPELREWVAIAISIAALLISIISLALR